MRTRSRVLKMPSRTVNFHADAAHGWLRVLYSDLVELGIAAAITNYSYQSGDWVYLEEDQDATVYMNAAEAAGWPVEISYAPHVARSCIRGYPSYRGAQCQS